MGGNDAEGEVIRLRILVACEESQAVATAFRNKGHEAYSCDVIECSGGHPEWHIMQDVVPLLSGDCEFKTMDGKTHRIDGEWGMIIAFPPCTHLAVSGAAWFAEKRADGRQQQGIDFFMKFTNAKCKRIAIENPIGIMSKIYRKPDQIIQPWMFGHAESKATCLWLMGLPPLMATEIVVPEWAVKADGTIFVDGKGKRDSPTHYLTGYPRELSGAQKAQWERIHGTPAGKDRAKTRSKTYQGIARAMANSWGADIIDNRIGEIKAWE